MLDQAQKDRILVLQVTQNGTPGSFAGFPLRSIDLCREQSVRRLPQAQKMVIDEQPLANQEPLSIQLVEFVG